MGLDIGDRRIGVALSDPLGLLATPLLVFERKDDPADVVAILQLARQYQADLIIMGTHGARGMRRVQIGNTTEEVVRRTITPVLTITHPVHKTVFPHRFNEDYRP